MTAANIADLKNRLSFYLREIRNGGEVTVMDHGHPIAKIIPFATKRQNDFVVIPAKGKPSDILKIKPVKLKNPLAFEEVMKWLREDRDAR